MKMTTGYIVAKSAKVGEYVQCPTCGKRFIKATYNQVFCTNAKTKLRNNCKDTYWNNVDPEKRCRKTAYYHNVIAPVKEYRTVRDVYSDFHPYEGLNDEDYKS